MQISGSVQVGIIKHCSRFCFDLTCPTLCKAFRSFSDFSYCLVSSLSCSLTETEISDQCNDIKSLFTYMYKRVIKVSSASFITDAKRPLASGFSRSIND